MKMQLNHETKPRGVRLAWENEKFPVEVLRKLRCFAHLRRREVKRYHRWAFFDL